jgi:hypothetical protein
MVIASQVMKEDDSENSLDMGPHLAYVYGGTTLSTVALLSLITLQMPDAPPEGSGEPGVVKLDLIPLPPSVGAQDD